MENSKKYWHFSLTKLAWVGLGLSVASLAVDIWAGINQYHWVLFISFILGICSIIFFFVSPMIENRRVIGKAYENNLLGEAINASLAGSKQKAEIDKYSHFLREITQADRLNPLQLDIDSKEFDNLFDAKATLSITEAPLFAWKNPEYSWFLTTHLAATLLRRIDSANSSSSTGSIHPIRVMDRSDSSFINFMEEGFKILGALSSDSSFVIKDFVRFYLLDQDEVRENKALCQQLVASHELFGVHLFIIDKTVVNKNDYLHNRLLELRRIGDSSNSVLDIMVYKQPNNKINYKIGEQGLLTSKDTDRQSRMLIRQFVQRLASELLVNDNYLIYPSKEDPYAYNMTGINSNETKTFLNVQ